MSAGASARTARNYAVPFLLFGIMSWFAYHASYISDDAYAQLMIARNLALHGRQTFSDIFPTNGFQPLWQYLLAGYTWQVVQIKAEWIYLAAFAIPLSAALMAVGTWQLQKLAEQLDLSALWLVFVPAGYLLMFDVLYTEAHALFAAVAVLARLSFARRDVGAVLTAARRKGRDTSSTPAARPRYLLDTSLGACYAGLAAAAVLLAQLEAVGLVMCFAVWVAVARRRWRPAAICAALWLTAGGAYLACNAIYFGGLLPVNQWLVTSFPAVSLRGFSADGLATTLAGYNVLFGWLPIVLGGLLILWGRSVSRESRHFALVLWGGCLIQLAWVALFTRPHADSFRHYVLPMILVGFALAIGWRRLIDRWGRYAPRVVTGTSILAIVLAGLWLGATIKLRWSASPPPLAIESPLEYLAGQSIVGATVLTSDLPGNLAWRTTPNDVVDATFRFDYRPLLERLRQSPNALEALQAEYAALGKPLRLILYVAGSQCLEPDQDFRGVTYYDPRALPERKPIGSLKLPAGPVIVSHLNGKLYAAMWDLGKEPKK